MTLKRMLARRCCTPDSCEPDVSFLWAGLGLVLILALLLRLSGYFAYPSIHHPDELFQYLEQAHRLAFGYGIVPWEYREGTRSWLLPGVLAGLMKLASITGHADPDVYLSVIAVALILLSLSVVVVGFLWAYRTEGVVAAFITAILCSTWFELVYFAPKSLTEVVAAHLLVIAVYLAYPGAPVKSWRRLAVAGIIFGLIVTLRVHLAPALLVAAIYICRFDIRRKWLPLLAGGGLTLFLAGTLDTLTWGYPFHSFVENIRVNIFEKRSHLYGIEPWSFYVRQWLGIWGLAVIPIALLTLIAVRRHVLLGLIPATIVLTHMLFAHKEYRFVFPAIPFVIILAGLGTAEVLRWLKTCIRGRASESVLVAMAITIWVIVSPLLAFNESYRYNWYLRHDELQAMRYLQDQKDLCGVGLLGVHWFYSGGYSWLHHDVPIIIPLYEDEPLTFAYNYVLANPGNPPDGSIFESRLCRHEAAVCVYRRSGACETVRSAEVNEVLRQIQQ